MKSSNLRFRAPDIIKFCSKITSDDDSLGPQLRIIFEIKLKSPHFVQQTFMTGFHQNRPEFMRLVYAFLCQASYVELQKLLQRTTIFQESI